MAEEERPVFKIGEPVDPGITGGDPSPLFPFSPPAVSRPSWTLFPLDENCDTETNPRPDVAEVIRRVLPDFAPELYPNDWSLAAEWVAALGQTRVGLRTMTYDEIAERFLLYLENVATFPSVSIPGGGVSSPPPAPDQPPATEETAPQILIRMWADPAQRQRLIDAGNAENIAILIRKSKTSVVEAGPIWKNEILPALDAKRYVLKLQRDAANEKTKKRRRPRS